ncbi:ribosome maturation factor RimP [Actinokineospora sp. NBRC 105648]|uniref:ribosome maturation factor RimP n=1 Tax=Actinokineospora sp. NBRC 105648 TaxID=3032206 RepID=UPI0024A33136|nr:ribosome maturation factor RimP [Actinokineospora sp. NBRC 105648]GLZ40078.1 ribosome maturation factor RimP [Actinokineospora sp. NBRC 105648]
MANQGQRDTVTAALEPLVAEAIAETGFELEQLDVAQAGRKRLVRVVVDGDDGVSLDQVALVSRAVAGVLDEHDAVLGGPYTLEVTSPGVDRPLTRPRQWHRARLRLVKVRPIEGPEFLGRVGDVDDGGVEMLVAGALRRVSYAEVSHAVVEVEFKQPPEAELAMLEGRASGTEEDAR